MRGGVNTGGRMTRKRTIHDLRKVARVRQSEWWARIFDELIFMYLSGARGINAGLHLQHRVCGFATNAFVAPDNQHILYANVATSKATLAATDKMDLKFIDRAVARADTMGGGVTMGHPGAAALRDRRRGALRPAAAPLGRVRHAHQHVDGAVARHPEGGSRGRGPRQPALQGLARDVPRRHPSQAPRRDPLQRLRRRRQRECRAATSSWGGRRR
jgi:hypothetical protein